MDYEICDLICTMYNAKIGVSVCFSLLGIPVDFTPYLSCLVPTLKLKFFPLVKWISLIAHAIIS